MSWLAIVLGLYLALPTAECSGLARTWLADLPINRFPMVQAHDCGTGYLDPTNVVEDIVYAWTKTQEGNVTSQVQCGARSFDWRPAMLNDTVVFHHGPITIPHSMKDAAAELVAWSQRPGANQTEDELVLLSVWDCVGDGCDGAAVDALEAAGIPVMGGAAKCAEATNWTLEQAMAASKLPGGGHIAALFNCPYWGLQTYNGRIGCTGFTNYSQGTQFESDVSTCISMFSSGLVQRSGDLPEVDELFAAILRAHDLPMVGYAADGPTIDWSKALACIEAAVDILDAKAHYACYDGSSSQDIPFGILSSWNKNMTAIQPPHDPNLLYWLQGAWAEHTASVILGFLHGSSLLDDETRSQLNARVIDWTNSQTQSKFYPGGWGINAVCDHGNALAAAMLNRLPGPP